MKKIIIFMLPFLCYLLITPLDVDAAILIFQAGENDNFEAPADPAIPDPRIIALFEDDDDQLIWFDQVPGIDVGPESRVMHTFINLPENIIGGTLTISVKAGTEAVVASGLYTDGFSIFTGDLETLSDYIEYDREFGPNGDDPGFLQDTIWSPGDSAVFTLDLSALPLIEQGTINFIPYIDKYHFLNVEINDETAVDYMLLTIETASFGNLTISNPNGGESLLKGQSYTITWNSANVTGNIQIDLYKGGTEPANMLMQLAAATENDGEYPFNPPDSLVDGNDYFIRISAEQGTVWDFSDTYFTIQADSDQVSHFYFPHIASNSTWETEICVINTSAEQSLSGDLKAYNDSGQEVSSTPVILAANARRHIVIGDELPNPSGIGYIIFESDSENVCGYTKFYIERKYRVAVPAVSDINAGDIYMSHIASNTNWQTGASLLNTTSSSKELTVEFDDGTTKPITIASKEHQKFTINSLFGGVLQPNIKSAVIKNGSGIVGLELFGSSESSGDNYLSGILLKDDTTTHIYYPHIASNSTWWTEIVAYNPSITSSNLTITPFSENGTWLNPQTITLAGKEKYISTAQSLNFPEGTAWFRIVASSPITGFELFGTKDGKQLGGYTGVGISGTDGVFAKTEKDGWTGIAFVNIENAPATVTMTAYDDSGNVIATENLNINAYEKRVDMASNLFSQDISNATYIRYSSGGEVVGFQLNGSSDNMMLDALPGM